MDTKEGSWGERDGERASTGGGFPVFKPGTLTSLCLTVTLPSVIVVHMCDVPSKALYSSDKVSFPSWFQSPSAHLTVTATPVSPGRTRGHWLLKLRLRPICRRSLRLPLRGSRVGFITGSSKRKMAFLGIGGQEGVIGK